MRSLSFTSIDSFNPLNPLSPRKAKSLHTPYTNPQQQKTQTKSVTLSTTSKQNQPKCKWPRRSHPPFAPHLTRATTTHHFSKKARDSLKRALSNSWAPSTLSKYSNAIDHFITFCDLEKVPEHLRFPTDEFVLCAFAASGVGTSSHSTICNKISAVKAWHHTHGIKWNGGSRLRLVLNGVKNLTPLSSIRPPRPPINARMLAQLIKGLDLNNALDSAIAACAAIAFWGQCRLGELLASSSSSVLSTNSIPSRRSLRQSKRNTHSYILALPQTKTKKRGEDVILTQQTNNSDPLQLLRNHMLINKLPQRLPLFAYTTPSGPKTLTKRHFITRCNAIWKTHGYPRTTGHSFRIGGTTELLLAGVPPDVVKTLGRWSSDSFLRYWRSPEDIAPQYTQNVPNSRKRKRSLSM
ncbi:hypothetical protein CVT25_004970 [Psilocybe cyanescens]|uniref:Core-binding (CB) domain-containing protein n=1 Tax=Psilocybe cyanescens TaxID=93625 RepID=A0A409XU46_PSICY|nr:hypothetical protein CVT25_004970 [Psilocybe cyanescens]